ncbi:MAG: ABC transporter ATP-binding protein [Gemmatimonadales bacterium]
MSGRVLFDHVWKRFHRGPAHDSLRDLIPALARRAGQFGADSPLGEGDFWAVRDVSFEVLPGRALGIIGSNGAGKSTTLRLLTKILRPTRGIAMVEGRVGSLIEVSAGFHQDLTGRENVFLQGAIMGMPQRLIRERFDDIVEFSGISDFIDTPVKRYSSGMNARLGFSIAVHLEPDVLIIDEVLSVGDAEFQTRAFGRIRQLVQGNIPVVIVSHQLDRIVELCSITILLAKGQVVAEGRPAEVVQRYVSQWGTEHNASTPMVGGIRVNGLAICSPIPAQSGGPVELVLRGDLDHAPPAWIDVDVRVRNAASNTVVYAVRHRERNLLDVPEGRFEERLRFDANLPAGVYVIESGIWDGQAQTFHHGPAAHFEVIAEPAFRGTAQLSLRPVH